MAGQDPADGAPERPPDRFPELQWHYDDVYDRLVAAGEPRGAGLVLDVGTGDGSALTATVEGTGARGVALDPGVVLDWRGPEGFARAQGEGSRLPFRDGAFGATLCMETIEWLPDPVGVVREMARVSRERVVLVQSVWTALWFDSGDPDTAREFTRLFAGPSGGRPSLEEFATQAGLRVHDDAIHTIRGERLQRGTYAFELLRRLREYLVVQRAGVRARRFDEWRKELDARAAEGAFSFSLERRLVEASSR